MKKNGMIRKGGKLTRSEMDYQDPDHGQFYAHGEPISINGAVGLIKNFWDFIKSGQTVDFSKKAGLTFGKESLLSLLSQKDCEGIRFYFAMKSDADWDETIGAKPDYWSNGITILAVGIKNSGFDIGADNGDYIIRKIKSNIEDDITAVKLVSNTSGQAAETVPPSPDPGLKGGINEIIDEYLGKSVEKVQVV